MSDDEDDKTPSWKRKLAAVRNEDLPAKQAQSSSGVAGRSKQAGKQDERPAASVKPQSAKQHDEDDERTSKSRVAKSTSDKRASTSSKRQDYNPTAAAVTAARPVDKVKTGKANPDSVDRSSAGSDARPSKERPSPSRSYRSPNRSPNRSPRKGGQSPRTAAAGPRVLRNQKKALEVFLNDNFNVQDFLCETFQDLDAAGVEAAASSLLGLRDHCYQQVQQVVTANHTVFLEACKGRQVLDECISKLRTHVQDVVTLVSELQQEPPFTQQVAVMAESMRGGGDRQVNKAAEAALASTRAREDKPSSSMAAGNGSLTTGTRKRPMTDSIEAQLRAVLQQLTLAASEKDYGTAVSLLGLLDDVMAIITRDTHVLAAEVVDVAAWRQPWATAIAEKREALMSDVESVLSTGVSSLSTIEIRGATACLAALAGECHAIAALLACHASRISATEQQILKHHNAGASSEEDAAQTAGALMQIVCIGIASAGEDIAALWGRAALRKGDEAESDSPQHTSPAAPLLARWAEHQVRRTTRVVLQTALVPYADSAPLQHTLLCAQVGLVACGTLELSHAVSVKAAFMAELQPHIQEAVTKALQQLAVQAQAAAQQEVQHMLNKKLGAAGELPPVIDLNSQAKRKSDVVTLSSSEVLISQLTHICKGLAPLANRGKGKAQKPRVLHNCLVPMHNAGPRLTACLRAGLLAVLLAFIDGTASGFQQVSPTHNDRRHVIAQIGQAIMKHLKSILSEDGPISKAVAPLIPSYGVLLDLSGLQAALSTAAETFDKMASSSIVETNGSSGSKNAILTNNGSSTRRAPDTEETSLAVQKPVGSSLTKRSVSGDVQAETVLSKQVEARNDTAKQLQTVSKNNDTGGTSSTATVVTVSTSASTKPPASRLGRQVDSAPLVSFGNGNRDDNATTVPSSIQSALEARRTRLAARVQSSADDDSEDTNGSGDEGHQVGSVVNKRVASNADVSKQSPGLSTDSKDRRKNTTGVTSRPVSNSGTSKSKQAIPPVIQQQQQLTSGHQSNTSQQRVSGSGTARHARLAARLAAGSSSDSDHGHKEEERALTTNNVRVEHRMPNDGSRSNVDMLRAARQQRQQQEGSVLESVTVAGKATRQKGLDDKAISKSSQSVDVREHSQTAGTRSSNALARLRARAAQSDSD